MAHVAIFGGEEKEDRVLVAEEVQSDQWGSVPKALWYVELGDPRPRAIQVAPRFQHRFQHDWGGRSP